MQRERQKLCQCPEWGDLHFYTTDGNQWVVDTMCQCPERGDLHFYETTKKTNEWIFRCVNALKGATFISTNEWASRNTNQKKVSMP